MIIVFTVYILLDTFVLGESYVTVNTMESNMESNNKKISTDTKYEDDYISITLNEYEEEDTKIYVADIEVKNSSLIKTAFAQSSYGKNLTEKTSTIAKRVNAILAINGDYYGVQEKDFVLSFAGLKFP